MSIAGAKATPVAGTGTESHGSFMIAELPSNKVVRLFYLETLQSYMKHVLRGDGKRGSIFQSRRRKDGIYAGKRWLFPGLMHLLI